MGIAKRLAIDSFDMRIHVKCVLAAVAALPLAAATVKPESVGFSEERLRRVHDTVQAHIDARDVTGAVTLIARKGRIVHLEAHGLMDADTKKAMATDAIFRIFSMSKPFAGVAILMLMEEGKLRLIASRGGDDGSVHINQDVKLFASVLKDGESVTYDLGENRHAWVQVISGSIYVNDTTLDAGDGAAISDETALKIRAMSEGVEFLLFDLR